MRAFAYRPTQHTLLLEQRLVWSSWKCRSASHIVRVSILTHQAYSCAALQRLLAPQHGALNARERYLLVELRAGRRRSDAHGRVDFVLYVLLLRHVKGGIPWHSTIASRESCVKCLPLCFRKSIDNNRTGRVPPKRQDSIAGVTGESISRDSPAGRRSRSVATGSE